MKNREYGFETLALHGGSTVDPITRSRAEPVHRTTSYLFDDAQHATDLFDLKRPGYIYTRIGNPTQEALERRLALLENGSGALALASGTAAVFYSVINLARQGDSIVSTDKLYGGTYTMFDKILPDYGIRTHFVHSLRAEDFAAAIDSTSKAVYVETLGNPGLDLADIPAIAEAAHEHGIPLVVDSTFTTPYLMRPLDLGADIVVHSLTKWIGGHGTAIGGAVVESGKFDWANGNFPMFTEPDESYHGIRWAYDLDELSSQVFTTRMRTGALRNLGAAISPDNAWLFLQGLETLPLRMERHCENAQAVAEYLSRHPAVAWVRYAGLPGDPSHELAQRLLPKGFGGMVVFSLKGGRKAGASFIEKLSLFSHLANVGDAKSLAIHPASTTHSQLSEEQQRAAGVDPGMVRLSIGIEHIDDIIADLEAAWAV
ncbi:MAG: O-acetylhomoserine aminocarboxypropyltransferase/cysteine synthase family protein [Spirochaetia bacterium]